MAPQLTPEQAEEALGVAKEEIVEKEKKIEEVNSIKADLESALAKLRSELESTRTELNEKLQKNSIDL